MTTKYFVDAAGRYLGVFLAPARLAPETPEGGIEVPAPPPGLGYLWRGDAWAPDPAYAPPEPSEDDVFREAFRAKLTSEEIEAARQRLKGGKA